MRTTACHSSNQVIKETLEAGSPKHRQKILSVRPGGWCRTPVQSSDQVIRENPASRGTEASAEVLVGPPMTE